jgi:glycosyltransferase involved in cell wall biosynthesis
MTTTPRVSIGLAVYNGEQYLRESVDSLLAQDFEDFELIICDNASDDSTSVICKEYADLDSRVRYERNDTNIGAFRNLNKTFALARGEYFKWAAHDDWVSPHFLSKLVPVLDAEPQVAVAHGRSALVDPDGSMIRVTTRKVELTSPDPAKRLRHLLWTMGREHALYGLMRRTALEETHLNQSFQDGSRILLAELALVGEWRHVPDLLFYYRVLPGARKGAKGVKWSYDDPNMRGKLPMKTLGMLKHHLQLVRDWPGLSPTDRVALAGDVVARFGVKDFRRIAVEGLQAGRIVVTGWSR